MKNKLIALSGIVLAGALMIAPIAALAQSTNVPQGVTTYGSKSTCGQAGQDTTTIENLLCKIGTIVNQVVPILIALGVLYFVWGVITYVISSDEEAKKAGRDRIIFGIVGLVVIIGMWGLVYIVANSLGVNNKVNVGLPTVPLGN